MTTTGREKVREILDRLKYPIDLDGLKVLEALSAIDDVVKECLGEDRHEPQHASYGDGLNARAKHFRERWNNG